MPICKDLNCKTQAQFNKQGKTKGLYCGTHKEIDMKNVVEKRICQFPDCKIQKPSFNYKDEAKGILCKKHKLKDMENVVEKRICQFLKCNSLNPSFNLPDKTKGIFCVNHKSNDMIDVKSSICQYTGCKIQANFNIKGNKKGIFCTLHKEENMEDVKHKKCKFPECESINPCFNNISETIGIFCGKHKEIGMKNVISKRCNFPECDIQPFFNIPGEKIGIFCVTHKESNMIDVKNKRCLECKETHISNQKYRGHCLRCFIYKFPKEKISKNYKIKEQHMVDFIQEHYTNTFTFDKIVGGCSKRRPDAYIDLYTHVLIIECDENQHEKYNCENKRIMELFQDFNNRPIVFIRFNPDSYMVGIKKIQSSFKLHKQSGVPVIRDNNEWNSRLNTLKETIQKNLQTIPTKEVSIENLFFDSIV